MSSLRVLVVGGGITGSMLTIGLARRGVDVDLAEISRTWTGAGHGITAAGNALRALGQIGVLDDVLALGVPFDLVRLRRADGSLIVELTTPRTGGPGLPATLGSLRSSLQAVLCRAVYATGARVWLGTTVLRIENQPGGARATLSDGTLRRYDLIVAADGIYSGTRRMIGIGAEPAPVGMGIWRVVAPRPPEMDCTELYYGGPQFKAGYSPISDKLCYAYVLGRNLDRSMIGERPAGAAMREHGAGYGGTWATIREGLADDAVVNYQWIESILLEQPWYRGRVIVIGDAAHACPPLIAQGAAQCAEDAVVLAEELTADGDVDAALARFMARRMPRVRMVMENSMTLAEWETHPGTPGADPAAITSRTLCALQQPA
ncbi:MAG TPA: FAD-dependent monooxygenase [Streptosporangiaceae bacterium]|nr:FAD-dependent monooxygenase [Streptosporangiaceae bacterium]